MLFGSLLCAWSKRVWVGLWAVVGAAEGRLHSWWMLRLSSLGRPDIDFNKQLYVFILFLSLLLSLYPCVYIYIAIYR